MPHFTRRKFVATTALAAAAPFAGSLFDIARAASSYVRPNVYSDRGKAMLALYERAVGVMKRRQDGDPTSYNFQWYTHWVPGVKSDDTTKNEKIARLPAAQRPTAQAMWNTCQGHGAAGATTIFYFLPWHRMELYFYEEIVRAACGDPTFAMPYWNYLAPDQGSIPEPFRNPASPLYNANRRPPGHPGSGVNDGEYVPNKSVTYACLELQDYYSTETVPPNFSSTINSDPHGIMHDQIGDEYASDPLKAGMSFIPTAAGDPVFFLHHCNIDRLWASWNAAGRKNPDTDPNWSGKQFTFANAQGQTSQQFVGRYSDIKPLGYSYDQLENVPGGLVAALAPSPRRKPTRVATSGKVALGAAASNLSLAVSAPKGLTAQSGGTKTYLVIEGLKVSDRPGTHYSIYLGAPKGAKGDALKPYYVGTPSFFEAAGMPGMGVNFTFDVTNLMAKLKGQTNLNVSIVPEEGAPRKGSNPTIDKVELVSE